MTHVRGVPIMLLILLALLSAGSALLPQQYLALGLLGVPLIGVVVGTMLPPHIRGKTWGLAVSASTLLTALSMALHYDWARGGYQFNISTPAYTSLGLTFSLGVDPISLSLVLLTAFLHPLAVTASLRTVAAGDELGVDGGVGVVAFDEDGVDEGPEEESGGEVEHVEGAEDDAEGGDDAVGDAEVVAGEGAEGGEELGDEPVEAGEADGGHDEEDEEEGESGHGAGEAGDFAEVAGVVAVVDHADAEEECAAGEAVVDHVEDGPAEAFGVEGEHAEDAEAEVGDGGVGDELLGVVLDPGDEGGVDDGDEAEGGEDGHDLGEEDGAAGADEADGEGDAEEAVGTEFEDEGGEVDGAGGGGFGVGEGEPGVEGEERGLDAEGGEEGEEDPEPLGIGHLGLGVAGEVGEEEGVGGEAEVDDAGDHEDGADEGVEEEPVGGLAAFLAAPDPDDEEEGDEGHFEEGVEEEEVGGEEDAEHGDEEDWLEKLAPHAPTSQYRHNRTGEYNADAHMKRQIMGREVVVAITNGQLDFGPWEQIFYGEFDGRRDKRVLIKIIGE